MAARALTPSSRLSSEKHKGSWLASCVAQDYRVEELLPVSSSPRDRWRRVLCNVQGLDAHNQDPKADSKAQSRA